MESKINELLKKYVQSINSCDVGLAREIWSKKDRISFIHPLGYEHSFDEIVQNFYINTMQKLFSKRDLRIKELKTSIHGDSALIEFQWDFFATVADTNEEIIHKGRETQFLVFEDNNWKISHIHYSTKLS